MFLLIVDGTGALRAVLLVMPSAYPLLDAPDHERVSMDERIELDSLERVEILRIRHTKDGLPFCIGEREGKRRAGCPIHRGQHVEHRPLPLCGVTLPQLHQERGDMRRAPLHFDAGYTLLHVMIEVSNTVRAAATLALAGAFVSCMTARKVATASPQAP